MYDRNNKPAPIWFLTTDKQNGIVESYNYAYLKRVALDRNGEQNSLQLFYSDCEVVIQGYALDQLLLDIQKGKSFTITETGDYYTSGCVENDPIVTYIERKELV